jgi:hypothetical protein
LNSSGFVSRHKGVTTSVRIVVPLGIAFLYNRSIGLIEYISDIIDAHGTTNMALRVLTLIGTLYVGYLNLFVVTW